jgi:hypothetical protein
MKPGMEKNQQKTSSGNYELSRLNATRHGILSRHTVLPWEPQEEYEELHLALRQEYQPVGITEAHLVEEIAGIIWRKRRLRLAETSAFRNQYRRLLTFDSSKIAESALLRKGSLLDKFDPHVEEIFTMNSEEVARELNPAQKALRRCKKALKILDAKSSESFQLALETLVPDDREFWEEELANEEYNSTPEDFRIFLLHVLAGSYKRVALLSNHSSIMAQVQGESLDPERLDKLSRYEVFLDRKLERTLAMLLKLQALRRAQEPVIG